MLNVSITKDEVGEALKRLKSVLNAQPIISRALTAAKVEVKKGYVSKWYTQMGMSLNKPRRSFWQDMKGEAGFFDTLGMFTGSTYNSIDFRILSSSEEHASGEVSVYGTWPNTGVGFGFVGGERAAEEDIGEYSSQEYQSDVWTTKGEGGDFTGSGFEGGSLSIKRFEPEGYIFVGPRGAIVKYPESTPFIIKAEPMRTKSYGPKDRTGGGVDFMYLTQQEEQNVFDNVAQLISESIDRL